MAEFHALDGTDMEQPARFFPHEVNVIIENPRSVEFRNFQAIDIEAEEHALIYSENEVSHITRRAASIPANVRQIFVSDESLASLLDLDHDVPDQSFTRTASVPNLPRYNLLALIGSTTAPGNGHINPIITCSEDSKEPCAKHPERASFIPTEDSRFERMSRGIKRSIEVQKKRGRSCLKLSVRKASSATSQLAFPVASLLLLVWSYSVSSDARSSTYLFMFIRDVIFYISSGWVFIVTD